MVTLLIISLVSFPLIIIALYFWQRSAADNSAYVLPPPPPEAQSLFWDDQAMAETQRQQIQIAAAEKAASLLSRAKQGEHDALREAHATNDPDLYNRVLDELVTLSDSDQALYSLMSFVSQHDLRVNASLARAIMSAWEQNPDRKSTSKTLHFAALSDDADVYREAVESALQLWRAGKIQNVSALELTALFDGEFWILSARSRSSGAGFVLKRSLARARRELKSAARAI